MVFSNQFGILGLLETWITLDELYFLWFFSVFFCFSIKSLATLVLEGECCYTVLLWSSKHVSVPLIFPSTWGWVNNGRFLIFFGVLFLELYIQCTGSVASCKSNNWNNKITELFKYATIYHIHKSSNSARQSNQRRDSLYIHYHSSLSDRFLSATYCRYNS